MAKTSHLLLIALWLFAFAGCNQKLEFCLTEAEAERINVTPYTEHVESFGAEGPYKSSGGVEGNPGQSITFHVMVQGEKIEKSYHPSDKSSYIAEFFKNGVGDGFAVIHKKRPLTKP